MRFITFVTFATTAILAIGRASWIPNRIDVALQHVLGDGRTTITSTITRTSYHIEIVTPTPATAQPTSDTPSSTFAKPTEAVQTWYGGQKKEGCDKTACASCRFYYKCQPEEPECSHCEAAPYCAECEPASTSYNDPDLPARKKCSLSPGRTVACDVETGHSVFEFGADRVTVIEGESPNKVALSSMAFFRNEAEFAAAIRESAPRKECLINPTTRVPCYTKGEYVVFGD